MQGAAENQGEFFALVVFGASGMLFMTTAAELLLVFIGLEISSISTYIMAGIRKRDARGPEAAIKYFLLGSFATAFFLYGVALIFGATGTTRIPAMAAILPQSHTPVLAVVGPGDDSDRSGIQGLGRAPFRSGRPMSTKARHRRSSA